MKHRLKFISAIIMIVALFYQTNAYSQPSYISATPLKDKVSTSVSDVKRGTIQLPVITWGGDIATIFANGNARRTSSDSLFGQAGLDYKIVREDVFSKQLESYLSGKSPFLRCTIGMCSQALELTNKDPRTVPVFIYQLTWSAGGDALVVKSNIKTAKDLKGKTIAIQAYGPHVDYLTKILSDAGIKPNEVNIKWLPDLSGTDNSPMAAFYESDIDAALVIIPDALALTSNGTVGTGSEDSVKGARILLSTKTANRIISDVYAVRSDYYKSNRADVEKFVHALFKAQEQAKKIFNDNSNPNRKKLLEASAEILLDSKQAIADTEGLYLDAEHVGYKGNVEFFTNSKYPRRIERISDQAQAAFVGIGLISQTKSIEKASWDYAKLEAGLIDTAQVETQRFDSSKVAAVVTRKQQQGTLESDEIFSFEVFFKPNQTSFPEELYADSFNKVIDMASTYGGALITIEGHSDPMGYLRKKKANAPEVALSRIKQSAKNLSLSRSMKVRDAIINLSNKSGIGLDPSQFAVVGHGISQPNTGICGNDPCPPKNEKEWRSNMRVVFRIIQVEAESSVFKPL